MSILWAAKKLVDLRALATRRIALALATYTGGALLAWMILPRLLLLIGSKTHALPQDELALLFVAAGIDLFVTAHSSILITGNFFPQKKVMLITGIVTFFTCIAGGMKYQLWGIVLAPILCQGVTTLWIVPILCWRKLCGTGVKAKAHFNYA